jgi:DNA polymerase III epsilon subunit
MSALSIDQTDFVVFDVETTGLEPQAEDRICEIGAIKLRGSKRIDEFGSLVNPQRNIPIGAYQVNNISDKMVRDAPTIDKVLPQFLKFIEGSLLVAYNADFDLSFINNELNLLGRRLPTDISILDCLVMSRSLLPKIGRYSLGFVAENLGIPLTNQHRALQDAELTSRVFVQFLRMLKDKGVESIDNIRSLFGLDAGLKHKLNNQKVTELLQAIDLGVKLKIKYFSPGKGEVTEREVTPKEIREDKDKSFLVAFCHLRNEERTFRVDGILSIELA